MQTHRQLLAAITCWNDDGIIAVWLVVLVWTGFGVDAQTVLWQTQTENTGREPITFTSVKMNHPGGEREVLLWIAVCCLRHYLLPFVRVLQETYCVLPWTSATGFSNESLTLDFRVCCSGWGARDVLTTDACKWWAYIFKYSLQKVQGRHYTQAASSDYIAAWFQEGDHADKISMCWKNC